MRDRQRLGSAYRFFGQLYHAVESDTRIVFGLVIDGYLVDNIAVQQVFHRPGEVLRGDALHGRTHAEVGCKQANVLVRKPVLQAADEIDLGPDGPF